MILCRGFHTDTARTLSAVSDTLLGVIVGGVIGFLSAVGTQILWDWYTRPIISIDRDVTVRIFDLQTEHAPASRRYYANRVKVWNKGRTAARNCKVYIVGGSEQERISWMIRSGRRHTVTLNAGDFEYVDLCAISQDGNKRIAPTEHGWGRNETESRDLGHEVITAELKVTSANAGQDIKRIRILNTPVNEGHIIEFDRMEN